MDTNLIILELLSRIKILEEKVKVLEEKNLECHKNGITKPDFPSDKINGKYRPIAEYLYENVSKYILSKFRMHTAMITGSVDGRSTVAKLRCDLNTVLTCFSPISKGKALLMPNDTSEIDILIATDCISEGQNLQDCDFLINYDIHWNPVRIIQRFGRIDRIGSKNERIQLVNFWPDVTLDEYIDLKARVETRMKIVDMTATGDDNILAEEKAELEYRKSQLKRLQEEVVDIEEMSSGISIMDLGLNEFRLDLLEYVKTNPDLDKTPFGLHAVASASEDCPPGVVFVLKNRSGSVNIDNQNRLHPFYMVYISEDGEVVCDHLSPKAMLDKLRYLCKGKTAPIPELYRQFNKETKDGRDMADISTLLGDAISSVIQTKEESEIDAFLGGSQMSFLAQEIKGLDDFELICFLVIKEASAHLVQKAPYRLVVAGGREFENYKLLSTQLDKYLHDIIHTHEVIILSGCAKGADSLGEQYARERGFKVEQHPAAWEQYGDAAGPIRNKEMTGEADAVIVFWDGKSKGSKSMINCAKEQGIPCKIVRY